MARAAFSTTRPASVTMVVACADTDLGGAQFLELLPAGLIEGQDLRGGKDAQRLREVAVGDHALGRRQLARQDGEPDDPTYARRMQASEVTRSSLRCGGTCRSVRRPPRPWGASAATRATRRTSAAAPPCRCSATARASPDRCWIASTSRSKCRRCAELYKAFEAGKQAACWSRRSTRWYPGCCRSPTYGKSPRSPSAR